MNQTENINNPNVVVQTPEPSPVFKEKKPGIIFATIAFIISFAGSLLHIPLLILLLSDSRMQLLIYENVNIAYWLGTLLFPVGILCFVVLFLNRKKNYGFAQNFLPIALILQFATIYFSAWFYSKYTALVLDTNATTIFSVVISILWLVILITALYVLIKRSIIVFTVLVVVALGIVGYGSYQSSSINESSLNSVPEYGSPLDVYSNEGLQKIVTINGVATFSLGDNVDYERWGTASSGLALIFTANGGSSGILNGGCAPGTGFFEVIEEDNKSRAADEGLEVKDVTFGNNTYRTYKWMFEPKISYYELQMDKSIVRIVYRPEEACAEGKDYSSDLNTFLTSFVYEGYKKGESVQSVKTIESPTVQIPIKKSSNTVQVNQADGVYISSKYPQYSFSPKVDMNLMTDKDIEGVLIEINNWQAIKTKEDCVNRASTLLGGERKIDHTYGIARVNLCLYYLAKSSKN